MFLYEAGQYMRCRYVLGIATSFLLWLSPTAFGQVIKVRVIDCAHGRPLAKQQVSIILLYDKGEPPPPSDGRKLLLQTDVKGEAQFRLPEPRPARLEADVRLTSPQWSCGCSALVGTEDMIRKGVVKADACPRANQSAESLKAVPGEILFLALPPVWWQRLLWPLTKTNIPTPK
jgi:hypothetical protein